MLPPDKKKYTVASDATLHDALALIEENRHRSLIVLADDGTVAGTLSDGDVRKAILRGRLLVTPVHEVMNTNYKAVTESERAKAAGLFAKDRVFLVPVVDDRARLVDVIEAY